MRRWILLLFIAAHQWVFGQNIEIAFRLDEKDLIPEGITFDPATKSFYVSSINKRKIVRIDENRKVTDFISTGQDGIGEVLGLKVAGGTLWACSNLSSDTISMSMVHQFNLSNAKLIRKWILHVKGESHLFNDMAISMGGDIFISDSNFGAVYRISLEAKRPELLVKDAQLRDINGIAMLEDGDIVVNASFGFYKINPTTAQIKTLPFIGYYPLGIDGLSTYQQSLIGIQNVIFPISINQYYLNSALDQIDSARVLAANHSKFDIPTTGVVVGDWFYFIANSQLSNFEKEKIKDYIKLKEVLIMRVKLNRR
jgi:hypothetical protein